MGEESEGRVAMTAAADETPDVEVLREDQSRINLFGRLNNKKHYIEDEISAIKEKLSTYEDAQTEMMLLDEDDGVRYMVGETYSEFDADTANEMLEAEIEKAQKKMESQEEQLTKIVEQMDDLKVHLKAKFGKSINLEENPQ